MPACPRAELISEESRRLRVTHAAWAVCHRTRPGAEVVAEIDTVGTTGARDEVNRWTPVPVAVA